MSKWQQGRHEHGLDPVSGIDFMGDIEIQIGVVADDWDSGTSLVEKFPSENRGWRLWLPKKRWYHRLFRTGPRMKFEWREPTVPEGEPVWIRMQMAKAEPPGDSE